MFRKITDSDATLIRKMMMEFYSSPAVLHPVPESYFDATIREALSGSPYVDCYLLDWEGQPAGYALTAKSWSNEVGGLVVWLEEAYVREAFRGHGLGSQLLQELENTYRDAARFRLEVEEENKGAIRLYQRFGYVPLDYRQMVRECPKEKCSYLTLENPTTDGQQVR